MLPGLLSAYRPDAAAATVEEAQIPKSIQKNCPQTSDLGRSLETLSEQMQIFQH